MGFRVALLVSMWAMTFARESRAGISVEHSLSSAQQKSSHGGNRRSDLDELALKRLALRSEVTSLRCQDNETRWGARMQAIEQRLHNLEILVEEIAKENRQLQERTIQDKFVCLLKTPRDGVFIGRDQSEIGAKYQVIEQCQSKGFGACKVSNISCERVSDP